MTDCVRRRFSRIAFASEWRLEMRSMWKQFLYPVPWNSNSFRCRQSDAVRFKVTREQFQICFHRQFVNSGCKQRGAVNIYHLTNTDDFFFSNLSVIKLIVSLFSGFRLPVNVVQHSIYPKHQSEAKCFRRCFCLGVSRQCSRCKKYSWSRTIYWKNQARCVGSRRGMSFGILGVF